MYCPGCGSLVNNKLKYCKNCGAKMVKDEEEDGKISPLNALITTLTFVALFGLGILVGLVGVLLKNAVVFEVVMVITIAYLLTLFGICFSLTRLMSKLIDAKTKEKTETQNQIYQPAQLRTPITAQLEEHREPVRSVTENTTRTFEKIT